MIEKVGNRKGLSEKIGGVFPEDIKKVIWEEVKVQDPLRYVKSALFHNLSQQF